MNKQDFYDELFGIKKNPGKVFKVQVTNCSIQTFWYADKIGQEFNVIDNGGDDLQIVIKYDEERYLEDSGYIKKTDAVII